MEKKFKLKDKYKMYLVIFLIIFAILTLFYVCTYNGTEKLNECLQSHDLDYCNRNVR